MHLHQTPGLQFNDLSTAFLLPSLCFLVQRANVVASLRCQSFPNSPDFADDLVVVYLVLPNTLNSGDYKLDSMMSWKRTKPCAS